VSYDIFLSIYDVFLLTILSFWKFQKGHYHFDLFLIYVGTFDPLFVLKNSSSFYISSPTSKFFVRC